jgi:hypothetical protein
MLNFCSDQVVLAINQIKLDALIKVAMRHIARLT